MMQETPFSVEAPRWISAPQGPNFSATLPVLPYHFLMLMDSERFRIYSAAIQAAVMSARHKLGRRPRVLDAGCGIGILGMTAALEGAAVWLCEAVPSMRRMCREVVAANASAVSEKRGLVQILPNMMSTSLQVGKEIESKFDIVISEVMDLWCLGEGVIPTMQHAHKHLLAENGVMLPSSISFFAQPLELDFWREAEVKRAVKLHPIAARFKTKFSPLRINQMRQHRWLVEEPIRVLEIDLHNVPEPVLDGESNLDGVNLCIRMGGKPASQAQISSEKVTRDGTLHGYGFWWSADLGNGYAITNAPASAQISWKQLVRWLEEPRPVHRGEEVHLLACHNKNQVNIDDVCIPTEALVDQMHALKAERGHSESAGLESSSSKSAEQQQQRHQRSQPPLQQQQQHQTTACGENHGGSDDEARDDDILEID